MIKPQLMYDVCRCYLEDNAHELGLELFNKLSGYNRSRDLVALSECPSLFDPAKHGVVENRLLRQVAAFFKKNAAFADAVECKQKATSSFLDSELKCAFTNLRLEEFMDLNSRSGLQETCEFHEEVVAMRAYIRRTLGDIRSFWQQLPSRIGVTSGATSTAPRTQSHPQLKLKMSVVSTARSQPYLEALYSFLGYPAPKVWIAEQNRVEFVPKSWKTHRTIACEHEGCMPFQLAFDSYVKDRLKKRGINLRDQERNQKLARQGSVDGSLATIDLSAASDTVAYNTVCLLFPEDWFQYVDAFRSSSYDIGFGRCDYHKFSSMGNGTTFVIETLIFAAACNAVGSTNFSVYGDDVIIEAEYVERLMALLAFFGFSINEDKSFVTGPFRESCGADWHEGVNITPFYVRELDDRKTVLSHLVNGLVSIGTPEGKLWALAADIMSQHKLHAIPFNGSTPSGVFVTCQVAYANRFIVTRKYGERAWCPTYLAYHQKVSYRGIYDIRALTLWYLQRCLGASVSIIPSYFRKKKNGDLVVNSLEVTCSRIASLEQKYARKRYHWVPPMEDTPDHLFWWSEYVSRRNGWSF